MVLLTLQSVTRPRQGQRRAVYEAATSPLQQGSAHKPFTKMTGSYGRRTLNTQLPVRSALVKQGIARLVLQWVTMRESLVQ